MSTINKNDIVIVDHEQGREEGIVRVVTQNTPVKYLVEFNDRTVSWWDGSVVTKAVECAKCAKHVNPLDLFPGNICLNCYAAKVEHLSPGELYEQIVAGFGIGQNTIPRQTKCVVYGPELANCPEDGGKWALYCEHENGISILQDTNKRRLAQWKKHSSEWCSICYEEANNN